MKKQEYRLYPTFEQGEVLTKKSMNDLVGYLDEQGRITRSETIGSGIIQGLTWGYFEGVYTIHSGLALTPNGKIIAMDESRYILRRDPRGKIVLLPEDADLTGYTDDAAINLEDHVLALWHTIQDVRVTKCNQLSCDVQLIKKEIIIKPEFIRISELSAPSFTPLEEIPSNVRLLRLNHIELLQNLKTLRGALSNLFFKNKETIMDFLSGILETNGKEVNNLGSIFSGWNQSCQQFSKSLSKLSKVGLDHNGKQIKDIPAFYFDFLDDLKEAYNEYADHFNMMVRQYQRLDFNSRKDDRVLIGRIGHHTGYREYFKPIIEDRAFALACQKLHDLITRIRLLIDGFIGTEYDPSSIDLRIIPKIPGNRMEDRVIPFYYKDSQFLPVYWKLQGTRQEVSAVTHASYKEDGIRMPSNAVYTPHGFYQKSVGKLKTELEKLLLKNDYPVRFEFVELEKSRLSTRKHLNSFSYRNVQTVNYYERLRKFLVTDGSSIKDLKAKLEDDAKKDILNEQCESLDEQWTLVRELKDLITLIELPNFYNLLQKASFSQIELRDEISVLPEARQLLNRISNNTISTLCQALHHEIKRNNIYGCREVGAFAEFRSFINKTYKEEYKHAEMGGAERFHTIYFAHYRSKVLFVFSK